MADTLRLWFDAEADYLEVQFHEGSGYMRETAHDAVMERVDAQGNILGFSILGVSRFNKTKPLEANLTTA
ncbi:MAG: DUF2283 domain-containing protein [Coprothermobacterota bacterium]|jgi:hypothetical protein|nr:DUF2283 domain-containing protein [Coprothermobacterota bacterium]